MSRPPELLLHGVAVYNPELLSKEELIAHFVARGPLFERLIEDLRRDRAAQHHLLIGQWGMGKTTLLRRLRYGIEDDPDLRARWLPLTFPEEQYNVANLSDFYLNCIDALGDALEQLGRDREARALDAAVAALPEGDEPARAQHALDLLLSRARKLGRQLLLLVDNVELILNRLESSQWALRELLSTESRLLVIGASAAPIEATYKYEKPFYDFFQIHELKGLTEEETREVLTNLSRIGNAPAVERLLHDDPARIQTLHMLAGGNPRTIVLLYGVLAQGTQGDVRSDLERLLDLSTPLYKARFEALPAQSQQIVHALAIHWDPISAGELAERVRLDTNVVSSQLNRLAQQGVVEKVAYHPASKTGFQIAERFFNIWYLMRASRRVRQRLLWLVEFLRLLFGHDRLEQDAVRHLHTERWKGADARLRHTEYGLALAQVVREERLKGALESSAMRALVLDKDLRAKLSAFVDLEGEDASLKPLVDRHRWAVELQETIAAAKMRWKGWDPRRFGELLGGLPGLSPQQKLGIAGRLSEMPTREVRGFVRVLEEGLIDFNRAFVGSDRALDELCTAIRQGYMVDAGDVAGAEAAALALDMPGLPAIALAHGRLDEISSAEIDRLKAVLPATQAFFPWFVLGWALDKEDRYGDAEAAYRRVIELNPLFGFAWGRLGMLLHYNTERREEAESAYRKAAELEPSYTLAWTGLGLLLHHDLNRHDEAEAAYRQALKLEPNSAVIWCGLGDVLFDQPSRHEETESAYQKAIQLDPTHAPAWAHLALVRCLVGKIDQDTEAAARRVVDLASTEPEPALLLAIVLARRSKWSEAASFAARFFNTAPAEHNEDGWGLVLFWVIAAAQTGHASEAAALLDMPDLADRFRPLREALLAIVEQSGDRLLRLAPEIRRPTEQLIARLQPQGLAAPPVPLRQEQPPTTPHTRVATKEFPVPHEADRPKGAKRQGKIAPVPRSPTRRKNTPTPAKKPK